MKKIITLILFLLVFVSFGFACQNDEDCSGSQICKITPPLGAGVCEKKPCIIDSECLPGEFCETTTPYISGSCSQNPSNAAPITQQAICTKNEDCGPNAMCVDSMENPGQKTCIVNSEGSLGLNMNANCLINGQCSLNIYKTLGIRKSDQDPKVSTFVQDIVLAVTTFIGTVITIILVISGILYIMASIQGDSGKADIAKKGLINSLIGLLFVIGSYAIVRLIQFIATAGGG